jgi:hypothetical protein
LDLRVWEVIITLTPDPPLSGHAPFEFFSRDRKFTGSIYSIKIVGFLTVIEPGNNYSDNTFHRRS